MDIRKNIDQIRERAYKDAESFKENNEKLREQVDKEWNNHPEED